VFCLYIDVRMVQVAAPEESKIASAGGLLQRSSVDDERADADHSDFHPRLGLPRNSWSDILLRGLCVEERWQE
jgi:hypothetical protein